MMAGTVDPKAGEVQLQGKRFHAQKTAGCWGGELQFTDATGNPELNLLLGGTTLKSYYTTSFK